MKKKEELTEEQVEQLKYLTSLTRINGGDVNKLYDLYRFIYEDKGYICSRCGRVIRNVWDKMKQYYNVNFK